MKTTADRLCGFVDSSPNGEPGGLPWITLRVTYRAALCPQAPQTSIGFNRKIQIQNRSLRRIPLLELTGVAEGWAAYQSDPGPFASGA